MVLSQQGIWKLKMISIYATILAVFLVAILVLLCIRDYLRYKNVDLNR